MTSKIKVDNINKVSDDSNIIKKCGTTTTIGSGASNPIVVDGSAVTLGRCGGTVALASGATQTGFGRTGTVDWQTSSIKTSTFTAANGEGYFANTSGGAFTMNLPAGTAGNIVSVVDYTNTFQTNNLTIAPNGSQKIGGVAAPNTLSTEGQSVTFVYVDDTEGWKNVQDSTSNVTGSPFIIATGGTVTTSGNCKIHTFTGPGTFTVCSVSTNCAAENIVSYMVIAGGGGGGANRGGGGGAGGFREVKTPITPYTASPLDGYPSAPNRITVTATSFPITVGAGGNGAVYPQIAPSGSVSTFSTITSAGGGGGGGAFTCSGNAAPGGSGGGGAGYDATASAGASGNNPPTSPPQGNGGGSGAPQQPGGSGGGGGGATASGSNGSGNNAGNGGAGATTSINGSPVGRAGGGGGGPWNTCSGGSASDGGGAGVKTTPNTAANPGTANTGGGGGAGYWGGAGNGGSGLVIIRYKFQ
jgi:hypothetical protein